MGSELEMMWHCDKDKRFSYHTYVPQSIYHNPGIRFRVMGFVHGTDRRFEEYRELFKDFADRNNLILIFPMFPGGLIDRNNFNSYKLLSYENVRYDELFLSMIDELSERYPVDKEKIFLYGWSGGGQFAHRFLYAHPERLTAVVIGAPGRITYIDDEVDYFWGTRNFVDVFNKDLNIESMRDVHILLLIGEEDTKYVGESKWGTTRMERLTNLKINLENYGINSKFEIMAGIGHKGNNHIKARYVTDYFQRVMDLKNAHPENNIFIGG